MIKVLIVDDEKAICDLIDLNLSASGYHCQTVQNGLDAIDLIENENFDLVLLDIMLPGADGFDVMDYIRPLQVPVIFITAKHEVRDRVKGLKLGADDYLVKPFDLGELLARIRSVMRRTLAQPSPFVLRFGDICFSEKETKLIHNDHICILPGREGQLLSYFLRNPRQVLTRLQIIGNVWGPEAEIEDGNLDNYIYLLRKKLNSLDTAVQIVTVHRQGYCLTTKQVV